MHEGTKKAAGVVLATFGTFLTSSRAFSQACFPGEAPTKTIEWEEVVTEPMKAFHPVVALIVFLFAHGLFAQDGRLLPGGLINDDQTSITYSPWWGFVSVDGPVVDGERIGLTSLNINSRDGIFTGDPQNLDGPSDIFLPDTIYKASFGSESYDDGVFRSRVGFRSVAPRYLTEEYVLSDLFNVVGSLETGEGLGPVDLVYSVTSPIRIIEWEGVVRSPLFGYLSSAPRYAGLDYPKVGDSISGTVATNNVYQRSELNIPGWQTEGESAGSGTVYEFPISAGAGQGLALYGPAPEHLEFFYHGFAVRINDDGTGVFALSPLHKYFSYIPPQPDYRVSLRVDITRTVVDGVEVIAPPPPPPPPYEPKPSLVEVVASGTVDWYRAEDVGVELPVEVGMPAGATWSYHSKVGATDEVAQPITIWVGDAIEFTQEGVSVEATDRYLQLLGEKEPLTLDRQPLRTESFGIVAYALLDEEMGPLADVSWEADSFLLASAYFTVEDATRESSPPWTRTSVNVDLNTMETHAYFAGDANKDDFFNQLDVMQVLQAGKYLSREAASWTDGDFNGDGVFDQLDISQALMDMPFQAGGVQALAVPELSSSMLLLIGVIGTLAAARPAHRAFAPRLYSY